MGHRQVVAQPQAWSRNPFPYTHHKTASDFSKADSVGRPVVADLRRPALGTARPEAASQDEVLNVSKVASNSSDGVPGIGHFQPLAGGSYPDI